MYKSFAIKEIHRYQVVTFHLYGYLPRRFRTSKEEWISSHGTQEAALAAMNKLVTQPVVHRTWWFDKRGFEDSGW